MYAREGTVEAPGDELNKAPPVSPAAQDQRVDLEVDKVSSVTVSEYTDVDGKISPCLGATEQARWDTQISSGNARTCSRSSRARAASASTS